MTSAAKQSCISAVLLLISLQILSYSTKKLWEKHHNVTGFL